jgi:hypothetical protein
LQALWKNKKIAEKYGDFSGINNRDKGDGIMPSDTPFLQSPERPPCEQS